jgi:hypothetical protein
MSIIKESGGQDQICSSSLAKNEMFVDLEIFSILIKYMDLKEIICTMMSLSRNVRQQVMTDNYIMFKKFIRQFSLNNRLKRSDLPAYVDVFDLIKDNI